MTPLATALSGTATLSTIPISPVVILIVSIVLALMSATAVALFVVFLRRRHGTGLGLSFIAAVFFILATVMVISQPQSLATTPDVQPFLEQLQTSGITVGKEQLTQAVKGSHQQPVDVYVTHGESIALMSVAVFDAGGEYTVHWRMW